MTKRRYEWINYRGETVVTDEDVCPPGFGLKVPVMLMDATQREVTHLVDAFGGPAGHKPGYVFADSGPSAESAEAYANYKQQVTDAWKLTPVAPGTIDPETNNFIEGGPEVEGRKFYYAEEGADGINARDAAYDAHVQQLSNAWRGGR